MFYATRPISGHTQNMMPLALRAVGYDVQLPYNYEECGSGVHRFHCGVFWAVSGRAQLQIAGKNYILRGGEALYYYPFEAHYLKVESGRFDYCWFTFDGKAAEAVLRGYELPREPFAVPQPPAELFQQAQQNFLCFSADARFNDAVYALKLLECLAGRTIRELPVGETSSLIRHFRELVDQKYRDPQFNVESAAKKMRVNRSTLSRAVNAFLGLSPSHYIENIRLNAAIKLLNSSILSAAEIAERCGFGTPEYFSRRIKKHTGLPPGKFRKTGRGSLNSGIGQ